jgi:RNA polymerase-binding transcription factor
MLQQESQVRNRMQHLRKILERERKDALVRVHEYRAAQEQEATPPPSDELDAARSLSDVETHASLIERAEDRLRAIDFALNLLEQGRYGTCDKCGEEIPVERLKAVPFATYCVDCQKKRNRARHSGEGTVDEPFRHTWDVPGEMVESTEKSRDEYVKVSEEGPAEEEPRFVSGIETTKARRRARSRKGTASVARKRK